jgi:hypothetical protein
MVAVRLSQHEQPHHCHGTGEIDDGRHICGLLVRAWYQALCQNAAESVVARQRLVAGIGNSVVIGRLWTIWNTTSTRHHSMSWGRPKCASIRRPS